MKKCSVVVGLQFGDEGKGSYVNELCSDSSVVVRFNGGHQAGHTVLYNGLKHTFSSFGSGTLKNIPTFWSKYCTVSPNTVYNEAKNLLSIGLEPKLYIDPLCPVTTPYDIIANQNDNNGHGTVGVGFGKTIQRHEDYYKLYYQDIFNETILKAKLENIKNYYNFELPKPTLDTWIDRINGLIKFKIFTLDKLPNFKHYVFEGAQGILLDQDFGFFPNVTRSNTTTKNVYNLISDFGINEEDIDIYYITRCYQTRHGNGFMTNENIKFNLINTESEINITGKFQGQFRKSILDIDLIKYSLLSDSNFSKKFNTKNLVITCLDQFEDINSIPFSGTNVDIDGGIHEIIEKIDYTFDNIFLGITEGNFKTYVKDYAI